jgi:chromate transporter
MVGKLLSLFKFFFFLGLFTFGGGLAMLPYIKKQSLSKKWIEEEGWDGFVTLAQISPGAIAVNCANLIGYQVAGKKGSLVAIVGMTLPSILVILTIALFLDQILLNPIVVSALKGILLAVSVLFVFSFIDLSKPLFDEAWLFIWVLLTFGIVYFNVINPLMMMGISLCIAIIYGYVLKGFIKK